MALAIGERADFADFLETLTPQQWDTPSLCQGWAVRDVVAHVISYDELGWWGTVRRFAHGRFLLGKANDIGVAESSRSPDELIDLLRRYQRPRGVTAAAAA